MALSTLNPTMTGEELLRENTEPLVNLEADDLVMDLAPPFAQLQDEILASMAEEAQLILAVARAEARGRRIDGKIDILVDELKYALLILTNNDTSAEPYTHYFKEKQPAEVKEPVLGEELDTVAAWIPSLKGSVHVSLKAIGAKFEPLVAAGQASTKEISDASQALVAFYEVGGRHTLVQKMNAERKFAHGKLGQLIHDKPALGLPVSFPDSFFLHDTRKRKKDTPASIDAEIDALKKKIRALEIKREKVAGILAAQETARQKKKSDQVADEIAKAEKAQADVAAKLAALKAEAGDES